MNTSVNVRDNLNHRVALGLQNLAVQYDAAEIKPPIINIPWDISVRAKAGDYATFFGKVIESIPANSDLDMTQVRRGLEIITKEAVVLPFGNIPRTN